MIRAALAFAILVSGAVAFAEHVSLPHTTTTLELPSGWLAIQVDGVVAAYRTDAGSVLAITRADVPNPDAWRGKTKQAYADQIERGIRAGGHYHHLSKKLGEANSVPVLDVEARTDAHSTVAIRVVLFRTYALTLAIETPDGGDLPRARAIIKSFASPKPEDL